MKRFILLGIMYYMLGLTLCAGDYLDLTFQEVKGGNAYPSKAVLVNGDGVLATVAIVGVDPNSAVYHSPSGSKHKLDVIVHDEVSRLTLLRLPESVSIDLEILDEIGDSNVLKPADPVYLSKKPTTKPNRFVSHDKRYEGQVLPLILCRVHYDGTPPEPGMPIFDQDGHLVALAHQPVKGTEHTAYALPVQTLDRLMEAKGNQAKVFRCWVGIGMDPLNDALAITSVRPDSPGKNAEIQRGDILISIDGKPLSDYAEVVNAFFYLVPNKTVEFTILRGTEVIQTKVTPKISPTYQ